MKTPAVFVISVLLTTFASCQRAATIRGSVFIVTRGGDNVKLGLVEVSAIPTDRAVEHLKKVDDEFKASNGSWRTTEGIEQGPANSHDLAIHIFELLPPTSTKTLTDADGRFTISAPTGGYFLAAKSSREIGSHKEDYYWFVYTKPSDAPQDIILSNQNLLSDNAALILFASAASGMFKGL